MMKPTTKKTSHDHQQPSKQQQPPSQNLYLNNPYEIHPETIDIRLLTQSSDKLKQEEEIHRLVTLIQEILPYGSEEYYHWSTITKTHEINIQPLFGGITNQLFLLERLPSSTSSSHHRENHNNNSSNNSSSSSSHNKLILRFYGSNTKNFINRFLENLIFANLSAKHFSPIFYGTFMNGRIEGYLPGRNLKPEEMIESPFLEMISKTLGILHSFHLPEIAYLSSLSIEEIDQIDQKHLLAWKETYYHHQNHEQQPQPLHHVSPPIPPPISTEDTRHHLHHHAGLKEKRGKGDKYLWKRGQMFLNLSMNLDFTSSSPSLSSTSSEILQEKYEKLQLPQIAQEFQWFHEFIEDLVVWLFTQRTSGGGEEELSDRMKGRIFAMEEVLCHNDLLSGNIMVDSQQEGEESGKGIMHMKFIDYEYGGYNYRAFDLSNHFCGKEFFLFSCLESSLKLPSLPFFPPEYTGYNCDYINEFPNHLQRIFFLKNYLTISNPECELLTYFLISFFLFISHFIPFIINRCG